AGHVWNAILSRGGTSCERKSGMKNEDLEKRRSLETSPGHSTEDSEELAHYDDAVIGKAFRWSLVACIVIVLGAGIALYIAKRKPARGPAKLTRLTAPVVRQSAPLDIPKIKFADITSAA